MSVKQKIFLSESPGNHFVMASEGGVYASKSPLRVRTEPGQTRLRGPGNYTSKIHPHRELNARFADYGIPLVDDSTLPVERLMRYVAFLSQGGDPEIHVPTAEEYIRLYAKGADLYFRHLRGEELSKEDLEVAGFFALRLFHSDRSGFTCQVLRPKSDLSGEGSYPFDVLEFDPRTGVIGEEGHAIRCYGTEGKVKLFVNGYPSGDLHENRDYTPTTIQGDDGTATFDFGSRLSIPRLEYREGTSANDLTVRFLSGDTWTDHVNQRFPIPLGEEGSGGTMTAILEMRAELLVPRCDYPSNRAGTTIISNTNIEDFRLD